MKGAVRETADDQVGPVIRCPECGAVVLRVARIRNQLWLDPTGARLVVMPEAAAPSGT